MAALHIHDGNWEVRKSYEVDPTGLALRNLFNETFFSPDTHIWVFDGKNAKKARKDIYPDYKKNRVPGSDEFYKTMNVFKGLLSHAGCAKVEVPGFEGDDVIAHLINSTWGMEILLHANDGDFHVFCNELVKMTQPALPKIVGAEARLYKTLVGDTSDFIPGIKGFGKGGGVNGGGFLDLKDHHKEKLMKFFEENPWKTVMATPTFPHAADIGLTDGQYIKFCEGFQALCSYWLIVDFLVIPEDVIQAHYSFGVKNYQAADAILKEIMQ